MYGNPESLKEVFDRALKYNDPYKVYTQLTNIYVTSDKMEVSRSSQISINFILIMKLLIFLIPSNRSLVRKIINNKSTIEISEFE